MEAAGLETAAFQQLTRQYMAERFNPATPDLPGVRYFSYGASLGSHPGWLSPFRKPHAIMLAREDGALNDGLVSVPSAQWGEYRGTLEGVSHLDLINWTNRLKWAVWEMVGWDKRRFNAVAFYLGVADMLAKEGL